MSRARLCCHNAAPRRSKLGPKHPASRYRTKRRADPALSNESNSFSSGQVLWPGWRRIAFSGLLLQSEWKASDGGCFQK